jgi:methyl-accepting chemotaxis protein
MSAWGEAFLGVIALATLIIAAFHLGMLITGIRMVKRLQQTVERAENAFHPIATRADQLADQISHVAARVGVQVDRTERLFNSLDEQVSRISWTVRMAAAGPLRQSVALVAGAKALVSRFSSAKPFPNGDAAAAGTRR